MAWFERWITGTRGRILSLLRGDASTVTRLADEVGISDNAVRTHLAALQRDGLVEEAGTLHGGGVGKPAQLFRTTAQGEEVFPKAYAAVLGQVLRVVAEKDGEEGLLALLEEVGRRVGAGARPAASQPLAERVQTSADLLRGLGGDIRVEEEAGQGWRLEGNGCPLYALVREQEVACNLVEALIAEATGGVVQQCCRHGDRPRCRFLVEQEGPERQAS